MFIFLNDHTVNLAEGFSFGTQLSKFLHVWKFCKHHQRQDTEFHLSGCPFLLPPSRGEGRLGCSLTSCWPFRSCSFQYDRRLLEVQSFLIPLFLVSRKGSKRLNLYYRSVEHKQSDDSDRRREALVWRGLPCLEQDHTVPALG